MSPRLRLFSRICGVLLLGGAFLFRGALEATMLGHMVAQIPMIFFGGLLLGGRAIRDSALLASYDRHGLTGLTALLFISAYWMIPRALEFSLTMPGYELAKFASWALLGAVLPASIARANIVIQLFYLGNFCAMTAIGGMLYQDVPEQLCNAYLKDNQALTGAFLIIVAVAAAVGWCIYRFPALNAPTPPDAAAVRK
ncbi:hypothetical protein [Pseudoduganella sp. UC29_71]|uniref:hypothetical protein n=1 Tax=Pseudoduganella sp. UC29_71 TaxID=3350174 RepID=UPI00366B69BF